jgi:hypothetical protein
MKIRKNSDSSLISIFKNYQNPDSLVFDKTEIIVELSKLGEETFMSRSQAKRILFRSLFTDPLNSCTQLHKFFFNALIAPINMINTVNFGDAFRSKSCKYQASRGT